MKKEFPKINSTWYIESKSGADNWYREMLVVKTTQNPSDVYFKILQAERGFKTSLKIVRISLKTWWSFSPKNISEKYPEYLL